MTGVNNKKKDEIKKKKINTIQYEPEDLQKAIDDCNNNNITPYKASLIHNVPSSTIRNHVNKQVFLLFVVNQQHLHMTRKK